MAVSNERRAVDANATDHADAETTTAVERPVAADIGAGDDAPSTAAVAHGWAVVVWPRMPPLRSPLKGDARTDCYERKWLPHLRDGRSKPLFAVGENWENDVSALRLYLHNCMVRCLSWTCGARRETPHARGQGGGDICRRIGGVYRNGYDGRGEVGGFWGGGRLRVGVAPSLRC